ncbi:MAG: NAD(P)-dependent alcohol dehydrogenase [Tepidisphaerales bacterium]
MPTIHAYAAHRAGAPLEPFSYDPGPLGEEEVEIEVESCGICHSDLSVVNDEWGISRYPVVPGHEVIGRVVAAGRGVRGLKVGDRVGVGWNAGSCLACDVCVAGNGHLCAGAQATIVGHHGGFATHVRSHWLWAIPVPPGLDPMKAGPLMCGGMTVFSPLLNFGTRPVHRVGVVGIGGLGHLAVLFARAWGCEVTALTSNLEKADDLRRMGAQHVVSSRDAAALRQLAGTLDLVIVTVNVPMDWPLLLGALAPQGRLHVVGAVLEPIPVSAFGLIVGERQVSGSPTGSPWALRQMLRFAARHRIEPQVEVFGLSKVNDALAHLAAGKARYRVVLDPRR